MKITNKVLLSSAAIIFTATIASFSQGERALNMVIWNGVPFDPPEVIVKASDFAPKGWKVEEEIKADVTADGITDLVIKFIEDKPKKEDDVVDRNRALVIAIGDGTGKFRPATNTDKLLQCTACGGAFYGVMDAPANVRVEKGVIVVEQDRGSRWVTETTYRFRYDEQPGKFILIGFDYASRDRAAGDVSTESTNYLTGKRITTTGKGKKVTSKTTTIQKMRYSIDEVDADKFDEEATKRLGLD